jgi:hypothetical protein
MELAAQILLQREDDGSDWLFVDLVLTLQVDGRGDLTVARAGLLTPDTCI